jgi:type I restriction enzyme R subunit
MRSCGPYIDAYSTLSAIYAVVSKAYTKTVYVDKAFQKKTNELVQQHIGVANLQPVSGFLEIDEHTIELIKKQGGEGTKVINLVKSIEKTAEENSEDPYLVAMAERARSVQESFEDRQTSTADALAELLAEIDRNRQRKEEQARLGMDGVTYFVLCKLNDVGITNAVPVSKKVGEKFLQFPNWRSSEKELRDLRQQITFAIFSEEDDLDKVTAAVDSIFAVLQKSVA